MRQAREPVLVQAFVAQPSVEGFDVRILVRLAWFDEAQGHLVLVRPDCHRAPAELLAVVRADQLGQSALELDALPEPRHVRPRDRRIGRDRHRLVRRVVDHGQATGTQLGNALYLPPELVNTGRWTHQSDIYQLGFVLISLLLGRHVIPPNVAPAEMGRMIREGVPRQAAEGLVGKHGELGRILTRMVCRSEDLRYPNAAVAWRAMFDGHNRQVELDRVKRDALANALKTLGIGAGLALLGSLASKA